MNSDRTGTENNSISITLVYLIIKEEFLTKHIKLWKNCPNFRIKVNKVVYS